MYKHFEEIAEAARSLPVRGRIAVAGAADEAVLTSVLEARDKGVADPVLVGETGDISSLLRRIGKDPGDFEIVQASRGEEGCKAVELVRNGDASVLMKGMIETSELLRPVVNRETGLRTGSVMSHVGFFDRVPGTDHFIIQTDGGMLLYPDLEEKKAIIENAVSALHAIGNDCPKVAVLSAVETVNPKMTETVDAAALKQMNLSGEITGCIIEGPISYDLAMSREIAEIKHYDCPYCGDFDILVVPTIAAGNLIGKCWTVTCGALLGGIVVGAKAPIVLTSRGSSAQEKFYSIAVAALVAGGGKQ
ncbi:MAG: phosphate butyryltransferase [Oscillospiraceae bacterium]|nr:phosphate butyryltransferase [Oscillospiraceae bacterium]